jgi:ABC-type spermidine/putrescine transport system permease subunit I
LNWPLGALMSLAMLVIILIPLLLIGRFGRLSELTGL